MLQCKTGTNRKLLESAKKTQSVFSVVRMFTADHLPIKLVTLTNILTLPNGPGQSWVLPVFEYVL